jgi:hypothetical protein
MECIIGTNAVSNFNKVKTCEWEGIIMRQLYDGKVDKKTNGAIYHIKKNLEN